MANRRQGYGGRSYYNNGPVNPWQVGNMPGGNNQGNAFNSANPANLLSQLSEPQAQLALALTKLLQPQQQVPSLLTMNTVNPLHNSGGFGPGPGANYAQRGRGDMNRRPRHDIKRNEPFNKMNSRNSRDTDFNRRRGMSNKNERKVQPHRTTVVSKSTKPSSTTTSTKTPKPNETKNDAKDETTPADEASETCKETDSKSEERKDNEKKRDWKEEKPGEESKEEDKDNDKEQEESENQEGNGSQEESVPDNRPANEKYEGIPRELLHCHICQKKMWDGESFEKHMNGRAHQQMFEKVEESYRIKADMMREAVRLAEEKINIEMERMKRMGKKMKNQQLSRCAMCDLEFYGQLFVHRKSAGHQKLKHFLHPRCTYCNKEFPTRMEWENHRHTPEHLRKKAENMDKKKTKPGEEGIMLEEECFVVIDSTESDEMDDPNALIDITDDFNSAQIQIPAYRPNRAVGLSLITPASGFFCKPCSRFFPTETASQHHAQSKLHYDAFIALLNEKLAETEEKKRKALEEDDEGNWKRRKMAKDAADSTLIEDDKEGKNDDGSELYDPAETFTTATEGTEAIKMEEDVSVSNVDDDVWNEVDNKIDEILETQKEEEEEEEEEEVIVEKPQAASSPLKPTPTKRVTRQKKN